MPDMLELESKCRAVTLNDCRTSFFGTLLSCGAAHHGAAVLIPPMPGGTGRPEPQGGMMNLTLQRELAFAALGTGFTCLATVLGAAMVFFFRRELSALAQKLFLAVPPA